SSLRDRRPRPTSRQATRAPSSRPLDCAQCPCRPPRKSLVSFYAVEPAQLANQSVSTNRQDEQNDQHRVHAWHVENTIGLDDQKSDAFVRKLGFRKQSANQRKPETKANAIDDRMPHGGQINLLNHLQGAGAKAPANANKDPVNLSHSGGNVKCHRKET